MNIYDHGEQPHHDHGEQPHHDHGEQPHHDTVSNTEEVERAVTHNYAVADPAEMIRNFVYIYMWRSGKFYIGVASTARAHNAAGYAQQRARKKGTNVGAYPLYVKKHGLPDEIVRFKAPNGAAAKDLENKYLAKWFAHPQCLNARGALPIPRFRATSTAAKPQSSAGGRGGTPGGTPAATADKPNNRPPLIVRRILKARMNNEFTRRDLDRWLDEGEACERSMHSLFDCTDPKPKSS